MKEKVESAKNIIDIEESISNMPKEQSDYVDKSMAIANYISNYVKSSNFKQTEVATKLGKHVSEISKWVSGFHNLTLSSIIKLESVTSIQLLNPAIFETHQSVRVHSTAFMVKDVAKQTSIDNFRLDIMNVLDKFSQIENKATSNPIGKVININETQFAY